MGEKRVLGGYGVHAASEFRRASMFRSGVPHDGHPTSFCYAPPDTGVSNLQLVALERLPSIEGATEILINVTFLRGPCRGGALLRPCRRYWFYDHLRRIRTALRADVGIGPYSAIIRNPTGGAEPRPYRVQSNKSRLPRKKVQTSKSGLHLLFMADTLWQLAANLTPPYQAARTKTPVR